MPLEYLLLKGEPQPLKLCPECGQPFEAFLRGLVGRSPWPWWDLMCPTKPRPYSALICRACKEIVGHESIGGDVELRRRPRSPR